MWNQDNAASLIFLTLAALFGCSVEKKIDKAFRFGEYQRVIDYYREGLAKNTIKDAGKANYYTAEAYRLSNRIQEAEPYYRDAMTFANKRDSAGVRYAQALKANGKYVEARQELEKLSETVTDDKLAKSVHQELDALIYLLDTLEMRKSYYEIKSMEVLNTPLSEYSPVYSDGKLYFTASRDGKLYEATGTPFSDIYEVETQGARVNVKTIKPISEKINSPQANEGCVTFTAKGRTVVFAKGNTGGRQGSPDVDLYLSYFRKGKWADPQRLNINQGEAWESTPAFSPDGRTLYFSSNRKGGYGGLDLYSAQASSRGRFTRVKNLGSDINTSGDELFPFISQDGKLYFSSDGHPGYGMLDIFEATRKGGTTKVENLGQPINSQADDFSIFFFNINRGFFTSNRKGGKGDDDLYTFVDNDPNLKVVNYYLSGVTLTPRVGDSLIVLPNTQVTLFDASGAVMEEHTTGEDGKFQFRVYEDEDYTLVASADGYLVKREPYTTRGKSVDRALLTELSTDITLDTLLVLDKLQKNKVFVLKNIYFDFNKYDIRPDAEAELNQLVQLLRDNPGIKIEMGSHTDSVDTREYNLELSQKRAEATVNYLISEGISSSRLTAKGYGEDVPIARNTNPDGTDNPEGRQKNRRTEFKILEIGDNTRATQKEEDESRDPADKKQETTEEDKYFEN